MYLLLLQFYLHSKCGVGFLKITQKNAVCRHVATLYLLSALCKGLMLD
jgi:hypothetical protein